jgi:hypothetical protein
MLSLTNEPKKAEFKKTTSSSCFPVQGTRHRYSIGKGGIEGNKWDIRSTRKIEEKNVEKKICGEASITFFFTGDQLYVVVNNKMLLTKKRNISIP